jgi:hypothetical protein
MVQHQEEADLVLVQQFFAARGLIAARIPETTAKQLTLKSSVARRWLPFVR